MFTFISARRLPLVSVIALSLATSALACGGAPEVAEEETTEVESELATRAARFETFVGFDGQHYFELIAGNGKNLLRSEGYASASNANRGIDALVRNGTEPSAYVIKQAKNGEYYFNVVATNGETLSSSELYSTKSNATRAAKGTRTLVTRISEPVKAPAPKQARFELFKASTGKFHFGLRAGNGEVVLVSEAYASKQGAKHGIDSVLANGVYTERFDRIEGEEGEVRIRLLANNGETIGHGEAYSSASNADRAIDRISELLASGVPTIER